MVDVKRGVSITIKFVDSSAFRAAFVALKYGFDYRGSGGNQGDRAAISRFIAVEVTIGKGINAISHKHRAAIARSATIGSKGAVIDIGGAARDVYRAAVARRNCIVYKSGIAEGKLGFVAVNRTAVTGNSIVIVKHTIGHSKGTQTAVAVGMYSTAVAARAVADEGVALQVELYSTAVSSVINCAACCGSIVIIEYTIGNSRRSRAVVAIVKKTCAVICTTIIDSTMCNSRAAACGDLWGVGNVFTAAFGIEGEAVEKRSVVAVRKADEYTRIVCIVVSYANICTYNTTAATATRREYALRECGFVARKAAVKLNAVRDIDADVWVGGRGSVVSAVLHPNSVNIKIGASSERVSSFGDSAKSGRPTCTIAACGSSRIHIQPNTCKSRDNGDGFVSTHIDGRVLYARRACEVGSDAYGNAGIVACVGRCGTRIEVKAVVGGAPQAVRAFRIGGVNEVRRSTNIACAARKPDAGIAIINKWCIRSDEVSA